MRPPARIVSASWLVFGIVESQRSVKGHEVELAGVAEECLESGDFVAAEHVLDIIAQVPAGDGLTGGVLWIVGGGDGVRLRDAGIPGPLERRHIRRADRVRPAGP